MAGKDRKGRSKGGPPFIRVPNPVYDSAAFRSLSPGDVAVLLAVIRRFNGMNNGYIALGVREAASIANMNKDTVMRSFQTLVAVGLIEPASKGAFSLKIKHASEWRLAWERCDRSGSVPSHAYRTAAPKPKRIRQSQKRVVLVP